MVTAQAGRIRGNRANTEGENIMFVEFWEVDEDITIQPMECSESGQAISEGMALMFPEGEEG